MKLVVLHACLPCTPIEFQSGRPVIAEGYFMGGVCVLVHISQLVDSVPLFQQQHFFLFWTTVVSLFPQPVWVQKIKIK